MVVSAVGSVSSATGGAPSTKNCRWRNANGGNCEVTAAPDTPGIVRVYDVHEDGTQVCLIMELIDAPSLARVIRRTGTFTPRRAARVGLSMLHTLTAAHPPRRGQRRRPAPGARRR